MCNVFGLFFLLSVHSLFPAPGRTTEGKKKQHEQYVQQRNKHNTKSTNIHLRVQEGIGGARVSRPTQTDCTMPVGSYPLLH